MFGDRIAVLRQDRVHIVVTGAEPPEALVDVAKELLEASQVVGMADAEMRRPVADLGDLLELGLPQGLGRKIGRETVPVRVDELEQLGELRIAERIHLGRWHVRQRLVRLD